MSNQQVIDDLVEALGECLSVVRIKCGNLFPETNEIQRKAVVAIANATAQEKISPKCEVDACNRRLQ